MDALRILCRHGWLAILLLITGWFVSCGRRGLAPSVQRVIVAGHVVGLDSAASRVMTVHFMNPFDPANSRSQRIDPVDGSFQITYQMPLGQSVNLQYENDFFGLYLEPGDSIYIAIDRSILQQGDHRRGIALSGNRAELNRVFLPVYNSAMQQLFADKSFFADSIPPHELPRSIRRRIKRSIDSLHACAALQRLPLEVVQLVEREIRASVVYYGAMYRKSDTSAEVIRVKRKLFEAPFLAVSDERNFTSQMFQYPVAAYMKDYLMEPGWSDSTAHARGALPFLTETLSKLKRNYRLSLCRDLMLYKAAQAAERAEPCSSIQLPEFRTAFSSSYVWDQLEGQVSGILPVLEKVQLDGVCQITRTGNHKLLPDVDFIDYLGARYPGKVIYLDVCTHWCGPCIAQFPDLAPLRERFEGKDVVFVVAWLNSQVDRCLALMDRFDIQEECFFFEQDPSLLFRSAYGLEGFPSYMLIDRQGALRTTTAGHPSEEKTATQIEKLL